LAVVVVELLVAEQALLVDQEAVPLIRQVDQEHGLEVLLLNLVNRPHIMALL
jgi:hypothetical protein